MPILCTSLEGIKKRDNEYFIDSDQMVGLHKWTLMFKNWLEHDTGSNKIHLTMEKSTKLCIFKSNIFVENGLTL